MTTFYVYIIHYLKTNLTILNNLISNLYRKKINQQRMFRHFNWRTRLKYSLEKCFFFRLCFKVTEASPSMWEKDIVDRMRAR